jgi:hypothetical protein
VIYVSKGRDVTDRCGINPKVFPLVDVNMSLVIVERISDFLVPWP